MWRLRACVCIVCDSSVCASAVSVCACLCLAAMLALRCPSFACSRPRSSHSELVHLSARSRCADALACMRPLTSHRELAHLLLSLALLFRVLLLARSSLGAVQARYWVPPRSLPQHQAVLGSLGDLPQVQAQAARLVHPLARCGPLQSGEALQPALVVALARQLRRRLLRRPSAPHHPRPMRSRSALALVQAVR